MLTEPLDFTLDYPISPPSAGGLNWITQQQLAPAQTQLLGKSQGIGGTDLRSMLLERFRASFGNNY